MRNILFVLLMFPTIIQTKVYGQGKEMFIGQIAGKKIIRENFDKNKKRQGKQIFLIGELKTNEGTYSVDVITELYDQNDKLKEKYTTSYRCNPKEFDVLLNVFPFTNPYNTKIKVDVTSDDFQELYELDNEGKLKDIHLKISVESGVLNFFGSKSIITLKDRKKKLLNTSIEIDSKAVIKAYMMGIRIKTINYTIEEYLTEKFMLQSQKFTETDGSFFTMTYSQNSEE